MTETLSPLSGDEVPVSRMPWEEKPKRSTRSSARTDIPEKPLIDDQPSEKTEKDRPPIVYRPGVLVKPLRQMYENIGGIVMLADPICGEAIINGAENCARSLDEMARANPKVRAVLMRLVQTNVMGQVIIAHLPIILAVLTHHFPKAIGHVVQIMSRMGNGEQQD